MYAEGTEKGFIEKKNEMKKERFYLFPKTTSSEESL